MDTSTSILEIVARKGPFTEADCVRVIELLIKNIKPILRHVTTETLGDTKFPFKYGKDMWGSLRSELPKGFKDPFLEERGFFFRSASGKLDLTTQGNARDVFYGIDRDGGWMACLVEFGPEMRCIGEGYRPALEIPCTFDNRDVCELVNPKGALGFAGITYQEIRLNIYSIVSNIVHQRQQLYEQALVLEKVMGGCDVMANHIIESATRSKTV